MRFKCDPKDLGNALSIVAKSAGKKNLIHVPSMLTMAHIRTVDNSVVITTTDGDVTIVASIAAVIVDGGTSLVPLAQLIKFLKHETGVVDVASGVGATRIVSANNNTLELMKDERVEDSEFPELQIHDAITIALPELFIQRLRFAQSYACLEGDTRPILSAVHFDSNGNSLSLVAADGFKLCCTGVGSIEQELSINVPLKATQLIAKYMKDNVCLVIDGDGRGATFITNNLKIHTKLVLGSFPSYTQLIPDDGVTTWSFSCLSPILESRLQQMLAVRGDSSDIAIARLKSSDESGVIRVGCKSGDAEYESIMPITKLEQNGDGFKIALNPVYLIDTAKYFSEMRVQCSTPSSPLKVTGDLENTTVVIMPMFIQWER